MTTEWELDDPRPRYRLVGGGFGLIGLALGLLSMDAALDFAWLLSWHPGLRALMGNPTWSWLVGTPITFASLIGSYLLWGRWTEPRWQRRAGLLLLMNTGDVGLWMTQHARDFGLS